MFDEIDANSDGRLSVEELRDALAKLPGGGGRQVTLQEARALVAEVDTDSRGEIDFAAFIALQVRPKSGGKLASWAEGFLALLAPPPAAAAARSDSTSDSRGSSSSSSSSSDPVMSALPPGPVVVMIRHGKTEHNKLGLFTGQRSVLFLHAPVRWVAPYLQWAAGEKICHLPQAGRTRRSPPRGAPRRSRRAGCCGATASSSTCVVVSSWVLPSVGVANPRPHHVAAATSRTPAGSSPPPAVLANGTAFFPSFVRLFVRSFVRSFVPSATTQAEIVASSRRRVFSHLCLRCVRGVAHHARVLTRALFVYSQVVYTSWLGRAIETAWIVLDELNALWLPINKNWRLNERMCVCGARAR